MRTAALLLCLAVVTSGASAQRYPDRHVTLNTLADRQVGPSQGTSWMHTSGGWGEFGAYRLLRDRDHAWVQRLGAYVELFRIDDDASLTFVGNIELIADPNNEIRFDPRAVLWEEGFVFTRRSGRNFWQLGYFHRCKHDVDNLLLEVERSLIFGSLQGRYLVPIGTAGGRTEGLFAARGDLLTIRQDDRRPVTTDRSSLTRVIGSLAGSIHLRRRLDESHLGVYMTAWSGLSFYSAKDGILNRLSSVDSAALNGGLSGGIAIHGGAHFRIGFTYEYMSDTGIDPVPKHAHLLSFGVLILDPSAMW